jgi:hypothetical protein
VLIDIVGVEQRRGLEGGEQVLGDGLDERLGMTVLGEVHDGEVAGGGVAHLAEDGEVARLATVGFDELFRLH